MHPTWQLLERHASELNTKPILWIDPPESHPLIKPDDWLVTPNHPVYKQHPGKVLRPDEAWPDGIQGCVLFYPKAKNRLEWWLKQIHNSLNKLEAWVVGENNGGIKSLPKRTQDYAKVEKIDSARHCVVFEYQPSGPTPKTGDWIEFNHRHYNIHALPGVFSQQKLDRGTAVLLDTLPQFKGSVLEFGCGSGLLSCEILERLPQGHLTALDIDWLAVESTKRTLAHAGYGDRATVIWSDGLSEVPHRTFDALVSNPPFHTGVRTHYEPSQRFFRESHLWLRSGGELWWVANDFLNYIPIMSQQHFKSIDEHVHRNGFRVIKAVRA